jgi:membrane associated rhomboid family serine protease
VARDGLGRNRVTFFSLPIRLAIGGASFAFLAIIDLRRNGSNARRWREYAFLLTITALSAVLFGFIGSRGGLNWCSDNFRAMAQTNLFRPSHFMTAWGAHLGGYVGGIFGGTIAVWRVIGQRGMPVAGLSR